MEHCGKGRIFFRAGSGQEQGAAAKEKHERQQPVHARQGWAEPEKPKKMIDQECAHDHKPGDLLYLEEIGEEPATAIRMIVRVSLNLDLLARVPLT